MYCDHETTLSYCRVSYFAYKVRFDDCVLFYFLFYLFFFLSTMDPDSLKYLEYIYQDGSTIPGSVNIYFAIIYTLLAKVIAQLSVDLLRKVHSHI